jgi:hypothetical protein
MIYMIQDTVKIKFVRNEDVVTTYQWVKIFLFFGYWKATSTHSSSIEEAKRRMLNVDILAKHKKGIKLTTETFWQ